MNYHFPIAREALRESMIDAVEHCTYSRSTRSASHASEILIEACKRIGREVFEQDSWYLLDTLDELRRGGVLGDGSRVLAGVHCEASFWPSCHLTEAGVEFLTKRRKAKEAEEAKARAKAERAAAKAAKAGTP